MKDLLIAIAIAVVGGLAIMGLILGAARLLHIQRRKLLGLEAMVRRPDMTEDLR